MKRFARFWSSLFKKHRFLNWIYYGIALLLVVLIVVMSVVNWGIGEDTDWYFISGLYLLLTVFWILWSIFTGKSLQEPINLAGFRVRNIHFMMKMLKFKYSLIK